MGQPVAAVPWAVSDLDAAPFFVSIIPNDFKRGLDMSGVSKNGLMMAGLIVGLVGAVAIAVPVFSTAETKDVVKLGDLRVTATEQTSHVIPPVLGPAALVVGVVLFGAAFVVKG